MALCSPRIFSQLLKSFSLVTFFDWASGFSGLKGINFQFANDKNIKARGPLVSRYRRAESRGDLLLSGACQGVRAGTERCTIGISK